jgi:hypothetical protein
VGIGGFISGGLDLIGVAEHLVLLDIAQGSVVFIIFTFSLLLFILPHGHCRGRHSATTIELLVCLLLPVP